MSSQRGTGRYPTSKNIFRLFPSLTIGNFFRVSAKNFLKLSLLIAEFFEEMDKLFLLLRLKTACYQGFVPSLIPTGVRWMYTPFEKRIFYLKTKNSRKPQCLRELSAEKIF